MLHGSKSDKLTPVIYISFDIGIPLSGPKMVIAIIDDMTFPEGNDGGNSFRNIMCFHGSANGAFVEVESLNDNIDPPLIVILCGCRITVDSLGSGEGLSDGEKGNRT